MAKRDSHFNVGDGHGSTTVITSELMEALNDGSEQSLIVHIDSIHRGIRFSHPCMAFHVTSALPAAQRHN
jgi:hypothetical protein